MSVKEVKNPDIHFLNGYRDSKVTAELEFLLAQHLSRPEQTHRLCWPLLRAFSFANQAEPFSAQYPIVWTLIPFLWLDLHKPAISFGVRLYVFVLGHEP